MIQWILTSMLVLMAFGGCAQPTPPEWYFQKSNENMVCGDGSGEFSEIAKEQSLSSLSHAIGLLINAVNESNTTYTNGQIERIKKSNLSIKNLFPIISRPIIEKEEISSTILDKAYFVRTCVTTQSVADSLEESLKDDIYWLKQNNPKAHCMNRSQRENYTYRKEQIITKRALLRTYNPESKIVEEIDELGYTVFEKKALHVSGDSSLIAPVFAQININISEKGEGTMIEKHSFEFHQMNNGHYLCVMNVSLDLVSECKETLYSLEQKSVDEGKSKLTSQRNVKQKMQRALLKSGLKDALQNY